MNHFENMSRLEKFTPLVPETEIVENFSRSGGAGGQNVNKVNTKVELRWNINTSSAFSAEQKNLIQRRLPNRINQAGELIVVCQESRTQGQNRTLALIKLQHLVQLALTENKKRLPTKPTTASQEQRLLLKKKISQKKSDRQQLAAEE